MSSIYSPSGKAAEYSPLALNLYRGCSHGCTYCYVPKMMKPRNKDYDHTDVMMQNVTPESLERDCAKHENERRQVLLSFTTDPYMHGFDTTPTSVALELFLHYGIPAAVLTKAPSNAERDFDLMREFGASLIMGTSISTLNNYRDMEPHADTPEARINAMKVAKEHGLITWLSMEPAFSIEEGLAIIDATSSVIDRYRIGKLNHVKHEADWTEYLISVVGRLRSLGKSTFVKSDLAAYAPENFLRAEEIDPRRQDALPF